MAADGEAATDRRAGIHGAAIATFAANGFAKTSMADIADAAGVSRPALYQYFRNKGDIFASAFTAMLDDIVDRALDELRSGSGRTIADRLDGCLQRSEGDLWERLSASPHADEIIDAKYTYAERSTVEALDRLRAGVAAYLRSVHPGRSGAVTRRRAEWLELIVLSPRGFKLDGPDVPTFRRRLTRLAHSIAAEIDAAAD